MIREDLIILSAEGCAPCEVLKKQAEGKIPVYDVTKQSEATKLAMDMGITAVPTVLKREQGKWHKCNISYKGDKIVINCNGKDIDLKEQVE